VHTDPRASPTGYPFKVVQITSNIGGSPVASPLHGSRERLCDLGYLREAIRLDDGRLVYRCAAEPVDAYVKKGGTVEATVGRQCLCNGLLADVGLGQRRETGVEPPLVTSGDDLASVGLLSRNGPYSAADVVAWLLGSDRRAQVV